MWYPFHPFRTILAKVGLAAVVSPVFVTDKQKRKIFGIRPDLKVVTLYDFFVNFFGKHSLRGFGCRLARLATAAGSRVDRRAEAAYALQPPPPPSVGRLQPNTPSQRDAG